MHDHPHHDSPHHDHGPDNRLDPMEARTRALETLLVEKRLVDPATIEAIVQSCEERIGPRNGARVVAKAWVDPEFAEWLKQDATAAINSLGFAGRQSEHLAALFNDAETHHIIVCTLCSCYPWAVLGLPPSWYKSPPYRSRVVIEPRKVLAEFGVELPEEMRVRVWDSTSEMRYLVIPQRPANTEHLDEEALAALVTRDSMIGTGLVSLPGEAAQ